MDPTMDFFYRLDEDLINNHFSIRKRLYRTNRKHVITGVNKKGHIYTIDYDENSLIVTIRRRIWLIYNKVIAEVKVNVNNESMIKKTVEDIVKILLG